MTTSTRPTDRRPVQDGQLTERAREALDRRSNSLDAATRSRLTQARYRAVEAATGSFRTRWVRWQVAGAAVAVCAVVLTALLMQSQPTQLSDGMTLTDLELIELYADLELVEEAEFYHWLEDNTAGPGEA